MFHCILVSLDGSPESEAVLPVIKKILSTAPAKIILLRVAPEVNYVNATREYTTNFAPELQGVASDVDSIYASKEKELSAYLKNVAGQLEAAGAESITLEYSFNEPVSEILNCVARYNVELIAMATHGRTGLNRLVHGSVTESVLHHAPCPMLIVRTGTTESVPDGEQTMKTMSSN